MPDISMCRGIKCPLKETCFRFRAKPDERQSMIQEPFKEGKCELYWEVKSDEEIKELNRVHDF